MAGSISPEEIGTVEEFEDAVGALLTTAAENDIDPRGSWVYRNGQKDLDDWEVIFYELD
ncbi:MAG: hypothetical protein U5J98_01425 [Halobacteriales archaeon]|nr:hypothetical protein [Halobacteriales archaeon]